MKKTVILIAISAAALIFIALLYNFGIVNIPSDTQESKYGIKFTVVHDLVPVEGVSVTVNDKTIETDAGGVAFFSYNSVGFYEITIMASHPDYATFSSSYFPFSITEETPHYLKTIYLVNP